MCKASVFLMVHPISREFEIIFHNPEDVIQELYVYHIRFQSFLSAIAGHNIQLKPDEAMVNIYESLEGLCRSAIFLLPEFKNIQEVYYTPFENGFKITSEALKEYLKKVFNVVSQEIKTWAYMNKVDLKDDTLERAFIAKTMKEGFEEMAKNSSLGKKEREESEALMKNALYSEDRYIFLFYADEYIDWYNKTCTKLWKKIIKEAGIGKSLEQISNRENRIIDLNELEEEVERPFNTSTVSSSYDVVYKDIKINSGTLAYQIKDKSFSPPKEAKEIHAIILLPELIQKQGEEIRDRGGFGRLIFEKSMRFKERNKLSGNPKKTLNNATSTLRDILRENNSEYTLPKGKLRLSPKEPLKDSV